MGEGVPAVDYENTLFLIADHFRKIQPQDNRRSDHHPEGFVKYAPKAIKLTKMATDNIWTPLTQNKLPTPIGLIGYSTAKELETA